MSPELNLPEKEQSPQERIVTLFHLLEALPIRNGITINEVLTPDFTGEFPADQMDLYNAERNEQENARNRSEYKHAYMKKIDGLIESATITPGCKEYLTWSISQSYDIGVERRGRIIEPNFEDFEIYGVPAGFQNIVRDYSNNPDSGSIFDVKSSSNLEMKIYNSALIEHELLKKYVELIEETVKSKNEIFELYDEDTPPKIERVFSQVYRLIAEEWSIPVHGESLQEIMGNYASLFSQWQLQIEQRYGITPHTESIDSEDWVDIL